MQRPASATDLPPSSPPHTPDHHACPACERLKLTILSPAVFGLLRFRDAAPVWLEDHKDGICRKTFLDYQFYLRSLTPFFGELALAEIHIGHVRSYQDQRLRDAGPSCINHEINTLKQILDRAGLWGEVSRFYHPLKLGKARAGCALSQEEEQRLFVAAAGNPRWKVAYWGSLLTATTTAGPGEITHLHLDDVSFGEQPSLTIRDGLKNIHRDRIITMNRTAAWAAGQMVKRYYRLCRRLRIAPCGDHYLLPGRSRRGGYDPWIPMGSWKKAWRALRYAADLPNLRMYDLRHQAITKLLEDPDISEQTVEEIAGQVSEKMKKSYSHIRLQPKREALAKLELAVPFALPTERAGNVPEPITVQRESED